MTTVNERAARIRMVVLDIDGVMSDGTINVSGTGELYKSFYVRDEALLEETGLTDEQVAYMGDDVPDLPLLMRVGLSTTPADGNPEVLNYTHWQSRFPGGRGAVRELSELILKSQGAWDTLVHNTYVLGK